MVEMTEIKMMEKKEKEKKPIFKELFEYTLRNSRRH
jgi:hypothetical protein